MLTTKETNDTNKKLFAQVCKKLGTKGNFDQFSYKFYTLWILERQRIEGQVEFQEMFKTDVLHFIDESMRVIEADGVHEIPLVFQAFLEHILGD